LATVILCGGEHNELRYKQGKKVPPLVVLQSWGENSLSYQAACSQWTGTS